MKKILGLDLGISSIGWALVTEAENENEKSSIVKVGVRVNPLTVDEQTNFEKGKSITTNANRTLKRTARRNLQRYKLRRENLIECLLKNGIITEHTILHESGSGSTFETYRLRAKAAREEVTLEEFGRILLMINKKRGYRSCRKAKSSDEGQLIDGMAVARRLYDENITPAQLVLSLLQSEKKYIPAFYRSDLEKERERIWNFQRAFYPNVLTVSLKEKLEGKSFKQSSVIFHQECGFYTADDKGKDKRLQRYQRRVSALEFQLPIDEVAAAICDLNGAIGNASGYLGAISDRSKELYFNKQTVGQFLMSELDKNPHYSLKNQVFYRTDYLNEFETIWSVQAKFHSELTEELKHEIRDIVIFYQRALKSQKGLVGLCEFESQKMQIVRDGKVTTKLVGRKVCPKSSPLFQDFKIWQNINNLVVTDKVTEEKYILTLEDKQRLFEELQLKEKMTKSEVLKFLFLKPKQLDLNYEKVEGNQTMATFYSAYQTIVTMSGHGEYNFSKMPSAEVRVLVHQLFEGLGYHTEYLSYNSTLIGKEYENQPFYQLWHLLYSYEGDQSSTGIDSLVGKLATMFGFEKEYASVLANISFPSDYGSLSAHAMQKILVHMREGNEYSQACSYAGYRHSAQSLSREELEHKELKGKLELLPRNSLRNPVVEKILNQMINVVNEVSDTYGRPDEIRLEMARELKKSAKEREELVSAINKANRENETFRKIIQDEFGISHVSRNDLVRYKLYMELKENGFKTLYSNTYIPREKLFSKEFDIEHIVPQASLFDDSFSNKTLEARAVNIEKSNTTAFDFVKAKYDENELVRYKERVDSLLRTGVISKSKHDKLLMTGEQIPKDFLKRDLRDSQYIARKAREILLDMVRHVNTTTGSVTARLREDWQLVDVMQELNWDKYARLGKVEEWKDRDGRVIKRITDWTKRNDHRHHAMDALTIAFTKPVFVQYLNNLNARSDKSSSIYAIEKTQLHRDKNNKLRFNSPFMPLEEFRQEAKKHLESVLISIKAKNKVITRNINITKVKGGTRMKVQLTPRGQLHNETIYGSVQRYVTKIEKVGANFSKNQIAKVANQKYRKALLNRLEMNGFDAKKAFTGKNSLEKNPLYIDVDQMMQVPARVKTVSLETIYTIRKEVTPDLKLDKVIDVRVRKILEERLAAYVGDAKKAFVNLDEIPIYLNEQCGIAIKRVTILGVANAIALHDKKDSNGKFLLDEKGGKQPVDYVNTSNNHHVAIFRDENGCLQEHIVSFYEAVAAATTGEKVIDHNYNSNLGWKFLFTMKQNEYFVFPNKETGFDPKEIDLLDPENYSHISPNLYRVQKMATRDYFFRHHLETTVDDKNELKEVTWKRCGLNGLEGVVKVRVNHLGEIVYVGEY